MRICFSGQAVGSECFVRTASTKDRSREAGESSQLECQLQTLETGRLVSEASRGEREKWKAGSSFHLATSGQGTDGQVFMSTSSQT